MSCPNKCEKFYRPNDGRTDDRTDEWTAEGCDYRGQGSRNVSSAVSFTLDLLFRSDHSVPDPISTDHHHMERLLVGHSLVWTGPWSELLLFVNK